MKNWRHMPEMSGAPPADQTAIVARSLKRSLRWLDPTIPERRE